MGNILTGQSTSQEATAAYNNFLCEYGTLHSEMLPHDAIQNATRLWLTYPQERQMSYALMYPSYPSCFDYERRSEYVRPPCAVALPKPKKCSQNKPKRKVKAKTPACKNKKKKAKAVASKGNQKSPTKKRMTAYKGIKSKKKTLKEREPRQPGFQKFYKQLRDKQCDIAEEEIVKKAAKAWCLMDPRQGRRFLHGL